MAGDVETIRRAVAPALDRLGLELYDVELSGSGRARTLRILLDRPGGVDLDAVTEATRALGPLLDDRLLAGSAQLEVSSPGLERPLRRPEHFRGAVGDHVSLKLQGPDGPERRRGVLREADERGGVLEVEGVEHRFDYEAVTQARTVFEWGSSERPGKASGRGPRAGSARRPKERSRS